MEEVEWCSHCEIITERYTDGKCKPCARKKALKYYHSNKKKRIEYQKEYNKENEDNIREYQKEYQREYVRKLYQRRRKQWIKWFMEGGYDICSKCGYGDNFAAIEFHHINPDKNKLPIATFIWGRSCTKESINIVKEELKKCEVLCCRCHRELHNPKSVILH